MRIGQFVVYRGYTGSIEYDTEDKLYYGKLLNIKDLVNYHAADIIELEKQYHEAIDDYIKSLDNLLEIIEYIKDHKVDFPEEEEVLNETSI